MIGWIGILQNNIMCALSGKTLQRVPKRQLIHSNTFTNDPDPRDPYKCHAPPNPQEKTGIIISRIYCGLWIGTNCKVCRKIVDGSQIRVEWSVLNKKQGQPILLADLVHVEPIADEVI